MDAKEFNLIHTNKLKRNALIELNSTEKQNLIISQKQAILNNWKNCEDRTKNHITKNFNNENEQTMELDKILSFAEWTNKKYSYESKKQKAIYQWDVFYCDLGENIGCEKNKTRPVLIIQRMIGFLNSQTVMIAPITIGEDFSRLFKHEILIDVTKRGKIKGKIDLSHIRTVDKARLDERFSDRLLSDKEYKEYYRGADFVSVQSKVTEALKSIFNIDR